MTTDTTDLLTIDLGTQSLRVSAYDGRGRRGWTWSAPITTTVDGDRAEQSPDQWAAALAAACEAAGAAGIRPVAIAAAAPLAGYVALDANGIALTDAVLYSDRRAAVDAARVAAALPPDRSRGLRVLPPDPLPQWLRLCRERPAVAQRARAFLDATGWINHWLTGEATLNAFTGLRLFADAPSTLPGRDAPFGRVVPVGEPLGRLRPDVGRRLGVGAVPVIAATFDSKCAYLGSGLAVPGDATEISGTVSSLGVLAADPVDDPGRRVYSVPFGRGHLARGSTAAAGSTLEWFRSTWLPLPVAELDALAATAPPGAHGLTLLPYLSGERTPLWNPWASGTLVGLRLGTSRADLARAVLEGLACSVGHVARTLADVGVTIGRLRAGGGLARSDLLCRIKADLLDVPVGRTADHELTSNGLAAILLVATGRAADLAAASDATTRVERWFEPDPTTQTAHRAAFERYRTVSATLAPLFAQDAAAVAAAGS